MIQSQICEIVKNSRGGKELSLDGFFYDKEKILEYKIYWNCELKRH